MLFKKECCAICGNSIKTLTHPLKIKDGSICQDCVEKEFTNFFTMSPKQDFLTKDVYQYRKYRIENKQKVKIFKETNCYFNIFHIDNENKWLIIQEGKIDKNKNPDVFNLSDITYSEILYNYYKVEHKQFTNFLNVDIFLVLAVKNRYYECIYSDNIEKNALIEIDLDEKTYLEQMEVYGEFFDNCFKVKETDEIKEFQTLLFDNMDMNISNFITYIKDENNTSIPSDLKTIASEYFNIINRLRKQGYFDKDYYKRYIDKNVHNEDLKSILYNDYF